MQNLTPKRPQSPLLTASASVDKNEATKIIADVVEFNHRASASSKSAVDVLWQLREVLAVNDDIDPTSAENGQNDAEAPDWTTQRAFFAKKRKESVLAESRAKKSKKEQLARVRREAESDEEAERRRESQRQSPEDVWDPRPSPRKSKRAGLTSCARCGATSGLKACSRCKSTAYCSQECQLAHWKTHRGSCKR